MRYNPFGDQKPVEVVLSLSEVRLEFKINPRVFKGMDYDRVTSYSQYIDDLPPMVVCEIPGMGKVLIAGYHRYLAHKEARQAKGKFKLYQGTWDQAEEYADIDNFTHGLDLSRKERRRVIKKMVQRHPQWSNIGTARACGPNVSDKTVASVKREMEAGGEIEPSDWVLGSDSVWRPARIARGPVPTIEDDPDNPFKKEQPGIARRKIDLSQRLSGCEFCGWPLATRSHLLDVAAWGDTDFYRLLDVRCHEVYDILVRSLEEKPGVSSVLIEHLYQNIGKDDTYRPTLDKLRGLAEEMVPIRKKLYQQWLERKKHERRGGN